MINRVNDNFDLLDLHLFAQGDFLRIFPWDSSPFFNHHLGEYVWKFFQAPFTSKSKYTHTSNSLHLDFPIKI